MLCQYNIKHRIYARYALISYKEPIWGVFII